MKYILIFIIYSVLGWLIETIYYSIKNKKFTNIGFLIGPYSLIYGFGILNLIILNKYIQNIYILILIFIINYNILKLMSNILIYKLVKIKNLYDLKLNIKKTILFIILSYISITYINPTIYKLPLFYSLTILFFTFLIVDFIITIKILSTIEKTKNLYYDNKIPKEFIKKLKNKYKNKTDEELINGLMLNVDDEYYEITKEILENQEFKKRLTYNHHEKRSVYAHSLMVSIYSYKVSKKINLDYKSAAIGGLLHDFYYKDWQTNKRKGVKNLHGFVHPKEALENSKIHFNKLINKKIEDIILKHMFPLTIKIPKYKESFIINLVDKRCSLEVFKYPNQLYKYIGLKKKK